jgi:hypothetical protein
MRIIGLAWRLIRAAALAFCIAGLAALRLVGERHGSATKGHSERHQDRRGHQRYALSHCEAHLPSSFLQNKNRPTLVW